MSLVVIFFPFAEFTIIHYHSVREESQTAVYYKKMFSLEILIFIDLTGTQWNTSTRYFSKSEISRYSELGIGTKLVINIKIYNNTKTYHSEHTAYAILCKV